MPAEVLVEEVAGANRRRPRRAPAPIAARAASPSRPLVWWCAATIAAAGTLTYWNSLSAPFIFDDQASVLDNTQIRRLWPLWDAFSPPAGGWPVSGRPFVNLSFAINYAFGGLAVNGYHVVNIGMHVACALLLFGLIRRTLAGIALAHRFPPAVATRLAFVSALLWTVHPLQTETIDYLSKRTELMMSLCYLGTLYCFVRAGHASRDSPWLLASVVWCAIGMACKESMATVPAVALLYDRTFLSGSFRAALRRRGWFYGGLAASWLVLAALMWPGPRADTVGFSNQGAWTYLLNQSGMVLRYLRLAVWPSPLVLDYGTPRQLTLAAVAPSAIAVVILFLVTGLAVWRRPPPGFLFAWFFIILAPTSSLVPILTEVGAESRVYLPLAAVACGTVVGFHLVVQSLLRGVPPGRWQAKAIKAGAVAAVAVVSVTLAATTWHRNPDYQSPIALWRTVVDRWPQPRAHRNLASALKEAGDHAQAELQLRQAVRGDPAARFALGQHLFDEGKVAAAIDELRGAVAAMPSDPNAMPARLMLARGLASSARRDEAIEQFREILRAEPTNPIARGGLADACFAAGLFADASAEYLEFIKLRPDNAAAWHYLGVARFRIGDTPGAMTALQRAVALEPDNGQAQRNLASVLLASGDVDGALTHARRAVSMMPSSAAAQTMLDAVTRRQRRTDNRIGQ